MRTDVPSIPSVLFSQRVISIQTANRYARLIEENQEDFVDGGCNLPDHWPEGFDKFNWLQTSVGDELVPAIQASLSELGYSRGFTCGCWASIYRPGEWIDSHQHSAHNAPLFITGSLCMKTVTGSKGLALGLDGVGAAWTWLPDNPGQLNLFTSNLIHATDTNPGPDSRISLNFDIYPDGIDALNYLIEDPKRYIYYSPEASVYSLPEYSLLDSERPPCIPTVSYD